MLDIQFILNNKEIVKKSAQDRGDGSVDFEKIEGLYEERKNLIQKIETIKCKLKKTEVEKNIEIEKELNHKLLELESAFRYTTKELQGLLAIISNIPLPDVPIGAGESENAVLRQFGERPNFDFEILEHWELGEKLGLIDTERSTKVSGVGFSYLKGDLVKLQFAIIQYVFDIVTDEVVIKKVIENNNLSLKSKPFTPILPPAMIKPGLLYGMARSEIKKESYSLKEDDLYLIKSTEYPLGAMYADEVIDEKTLPIRYIGYSTIFNKKNGSKYKSAKGILRQCQFDQLVFESFSLPETSKQEQDLLVALQEHMLQELELPYQVVAVCTGAMSRADMRQIDIEIWMPGEGLYRKTHSAELIGEYQSRRLSTKIKRTDETKEHLHMNTAIAFSINSLIVAIIENGQTSDGKINIPKKLTKYIGFSTIG